MTKQNPELRKVRYSIAIELPLSADELFRHLIDLPKWWPEDLIGDGLKPGGEFGLTTGKGHYSRNRVAEFIPGKKLVWVTTESLRETDGFDWTGTTFNFELTPKGENTLLKFTYDGIVLQHEMEKLKQICDTCINGMFYDFVINGKTK